MSHGPSNPISQDPLTSFFCLFVSFCLVGFFFFCPSELLCSLQSPGEPMLPKILKDRGSIPAQCISLKHNHLPELRFSVDMKAGNLFAICNHPQLVLEHE